MNNQDQVPTIAELWGEFQRLHARFLRLYAGTMPDNVHPDAYMRGKDDLKHKVQSLRQQLLERCKEVNDADRDTTKLWVCCDGDRLAIQTPGILEFVGSPKELRELGAACNFWAWEHEQREKEKKG